MITPSPLPVDIVSNPTDWWAIGASLLASFVALGLATASNWRDNRLRREAAEEQAKTEETRAIRDARKVVYEYVLGTGAASSFRVVNASDRPILSVSIIQGIGLTANGQNAQWRPVPHNSIPVILPRSEWIVPGGWFLSGVEDPRALEIAELPGSAWPELHWVDDEGRGFTTDGGGAVVEKVPTAEPATAPSHWWQRRGTD
jgi:hypothetical protein